MFRLDPRGRVDDALKCRVMGLEDANHLVKGPLEPDVALEKIVREFMKEYETRMIFKLLAEVKDFHPELRWCARQLVEDDRSLVKQHIKKLSRTG